MLLTGVFQCENTTLQLFQGEYLFLRGSTYLPVNKYGGSSYFTVNNYCELLFFFSGDYLLTVTGTPLLLCLCFFPSTVSLPSVFTFFLITLDEVLILGR